MSENTEQLQKLRAPFPKHQINTLPKPYDKNAQKGRCPECGGWHGLPAVHLDYVGHAALTDRFLEVDPTWTWEPVAFGPDGLPLLDKQGGLWIRLTICGVTRLGYGDSQGKTGPNAIKEAIGDALRNAGMRFGAALDLWHKGDLHAADEERGTAEPVRETGPEPIDLGKLQELLDGTDTLDGLSKLYDSMKNAPNIRAANPLFHAAKARISQAESAA